MNNEAFLSTGGDFEFVMTHDRLHITDEVLDRTLETLRKNGGDPILVEGCEDVTAHMYEDSEKLIDLLVSCDKCETQYMVLRKPDEDHWHKELHGSSRSCRTFEIE